MKLQLSLSLLALALLFGCGSKAKIGETCKTASATTTECVDGAVCTNISSSLTCRASCTDNAQCASTENCKGISGSSLKSCQPN